MNLFERLMNRSEPRSGAVAKQRLKLVLEYDRTLLSPGQLDLIRNDIIESISRHVLVDRDEVQVSLKSGSRLVAEVPLSTSRQLEPQTR
jgi:cell division topological specificity factor